MPNNKNTSFTTYVLWAVFFALLVVLLPHTAWAFRQYEPDVSPVIYGDFDVADLISYVVAFAFEAAIAVLTHKLAKRFEVTPKKADYWAKMQFRYMNGIAFGLFIATLVSGMANLAHAVEFGKTLAIFTKWGIPQDIYSFAFGGILPLVSLTFANVLSNVVEDEEAPNPELTTANEQIKSLRQQLRESEARVKQSEEQRRQAEGQRRLAEERFNAIGDLVKYLFGDDKKQRIVAARQQWRDLPNKAIAIITGTSEAYVSEVLNSALLIEA